ncbi:unnamed protein product, partial [Closterium sp. NIES-54]
PPLPLSLPLPLFLSPSHPHQLLLFSPSGEPQACIELPWPGLGVRAVAPSPAFSLGTTSHSIAPCNANSSSSSTGGGSGALPGASSGALVAVGCSADRLLRVFRAADGRPVVELPHAPAVKITLAAAAVVYEECLGVSEAATTMAPGELCPDSMCPVMPFLIAYALCSDIRVLELPVQLPVQKPPVDKPNPKQGVGLIQWSANGEYLATRCDDIPTVLWIWAARRKFELVAVLLQRQPIRAAAWHPSVPSIAFCSGTPHLFTWKPVKVSDGVSNKRVDDGGSTEGVDGAGAADAVVQKERLQEEYDKLESVYNADVSKALKAYQRTCDPLFE